MNLVQLLNEKLDMNVKRPDSYGDWLGYEIEKADKGNVTTFLKIREDHLSPSGAVHGGAISGFLDFSCGCAVFSVLEKGSLCSTVELNVKYFKPVQNGDKIISYAEVVNQGKRLCSVLAKVYKEGDERNPVALATGTFNIYPIKKS